MKRFALILLLFPALAFGQLSKSSVYFVTAGDSTAFWFVTTYDLNSGLSTRQVAGTYLVPLDTSSLVARFAAKQAAGTYLIPSDTSSLAARFALKQAAGTYLVPSDTSSLAARFALKQAAGTYLIPSDTSSLADRFAAKQAAGTYLTPTDTSSLVARFAAKQAAGTYIVPTDTTTSRTYSNATYGVALSGSGDPSASLGKNGDIYWDTVGLYEWRKSGGTWRQQP